MEAQWWGLGAGILRMLPWGGGVVLEYSQGGQALTREMSLRGIDSLASQIQGHWCSGMNLGQLS